MEISQMLFTVVVLKNFTKFRGKHLIRGLFLTEGSDTGSFLWTLRQQFYIYFSDRLLLKVKEYANINENRI